MASLFQRILQAQAAFSAELLAKPNVVGVAIGYKESNGVRTNEPAVVVLVQEKKPITALSAEDEIPKMVDGVRTDVFEIGFVEAQQNVNPRGRFRPTFPPGISCGHFKVTAGTLGAVVRDRTSGERFILSNNHVLANSNEAQVGDPILQPGALDGGQNPGDVVARLERFIPLNYLEGPVGTPTPTPTPPPGGSGPDSGCDIANVLVSTGNLFAKLFGSEKRVQATSASASSATPVAQAAPVAKAQAVDNTIDAALAAPVNPQALANDILNIGAIVGTKPASIGQGIRKMGRTSGFTQGTINLMNATVNVSYTTSMGPRTARFTGQIIATAMSQGGDSGSLIVDGTENKAVGLLFAGSTVATIFTPIDVVLSTLNVMF